MGCTFISDWNAQSVSIQNQGALNILEVSGSVLVMAKELMNVLFVFLTSF